MSITYTPSTNFGAKDSLPSNDSNKVIRGSEFTTEFTAIQTAFGLAAPAASPTFTGTATLASVDINGGTIDGVTIGGSSAGAITGTTGQFNTSLNVDGTVTADGLEVFADGDVEINVDNDDTNGATSFYVTGRSGQEKVARFEASGDISFYEDTGTTAKLFWDASDESLDLSGRFYNTRGNHRGQIYGSGDNFIIRHDSSSVGLLALSRAGSLDLVVDSSGNVGIGTSSPSGNLHVDGGEVFFTSTGNSKLQINAGNTSSSFIEFGDPDDGNVGRLLYGHSDNSMQFRVNTAERMRIDSSGNVGIGTSSPGYKLSVSATGNISGEFRTSGAINALFLADAGTTAGTLYIGTVGNDFRVVTGSEERMRIDSSGNLLVGKSTVAQNTVAGIEIKPAGDISSVNTFANGVGENIFLNRHNGTGDFILFRKTNVTVGSISTNGSTTSYNTSSDARLKEKIADAEDAGAKVDAIQVRQFDWKADGSHQDYGMVAQELLTVAPEAVSGDPESDEMMGVDYSKLVPMLVKEIQSLRARVAQLEGA